MTALGERIKALRQERALQQRQLAEKAELTPSMVSQIESGRLTPSLNTLGRIAGALSVPIAALQRENGKASVFVVDAKTSTAKLRTVQTGAFGEDRVPVKSGLRADEWVVAAGGHLLRDGQKVQPVDRDNRPVLKAATAAATK